MATRTRKGQSSPTTADQPIPCASAEASVAAEDSDAPVQTVKVTRKGLTVTLPTAFWPRLFLGAVAFASVVAGCILYDLATDPDVWSDD